MQTALDRKGFNVKHVDGKWGPHTEAALKKFQQKQNLQDSGRIDRQTLAALGVTMQGQQGSATTGSGSNESRMNRPAQNPGKLNATGQPHQSNGQQAGGGNENSPAVNDGH